MKSKKNDSSCGAECKCTVNIAETTDMPNEVISIAIKSYDWQLYRIAEREKMLSTLAAWSIPLPLLIMLWGLGQGGEFGILLVIVGVFLLARIGVFGWGMVETFVTLLHPDNIENKILEGITEEELKLNILASSVYGFDENFKSVTQKCNCFLISLTLLILELISLFVWISNFK